ncbi:hypothetical protein BX666DRAFT_1850875 [Dichotomocladium elegans]|nr:hypothetical protein BX666DRAFT_1850875 [Dichotomocladium elegans]
MRESTLHGTDLPLLLEDRYDIEGVEARSVFGFAIHQQTRFTFVFRIPDHPWFEDLIGLRRTAYFTMKTQSGETRELHLKGSKDSTYLLGYLCKREDIIQAATNAVGATVNNRKLPLVLDLDDTLVRLVGDGNDRHVPEADAYKYADRLATLNDGKQVVLAENVHEFLDWAHNLFDISVCSLGDQQYMESVINVLDPNHTKICGIKYSARSEHDYIQRSHNTRRAAKDLKALYPFSILPDDTLGAGHRLPLIVDDETRMWPADQHDNIIVVKNQSNNPLWNVRLNTVVKDTLSFIHQEYFRQLDQWRLRKLEAEQANAVYSRPQPSAVGIYKAMLRSMLRDKIAGA